MEQKFRMIDVGEKAPTRRRALARGRITVSPKTADMIRRRDSPKGDILAMAEVAGILAVKETPRLLPLCHPLAIDAVRLWFEPFEQGVDAFCDVICHGKTGVEMEALVGVNVALLTVYDLAKAVDPVIEIGDVRLVEKEGGRSGRWRHPRDPHMPLTNADAPDAPAAVLRGLHFSVVTMSDRAARGDYLDEGGPLLRRFGLDRGGAEIGSVVLPDDAELLRKSVMELAEKRVDLILVTGGTGIGARDISPETVRSIASKELIGFGELQRLRGSSKTSRAWLSRSSAYVVSGSLVVLFPGSPRAVIDGIEAVGDLIPHAIQMIKGGSHDSLR